MFHLFVLVSFISGLFASSCFASNQSDNEPSSRENSPTTVVFDLDGTLIRSCPLNGRFKNVRVKYQEYYPESFSIVSKANHGDCDLSYYLAPYTRVLFQYLIDHTDFKVHFFSAGSKERNEDVVPKILGHVFGSEKYQELVSQGQFKIYSNEHTREGIKSLANIGLDPKRSILIDDVPGYADPLEGAFLHLYSAKLANFTFNDIDQKRRLSDLRSLNSQTIHANLYFLGVLGVLHDLSTWSDRSVKEHLVDFYESATLQSNGLSSGQVFMREEETMSAGESKFIVNFIKHGLHLAKQVNSSVILTTRLPCLH